MTIEHSLSESSIDKKTVYRICGDRFLTMEFGDEVDLSLNYKAIAMKEVIEQEHIRGICEIFSATVSLTIYYDPFNIKVDDLIRELQELEQKGIAYEKKIPSRVIKVPVLFNDRWTTACMKAHNIFPPDIESVAEYNGLSIEEFIGVYTSTDYWVKYVGFSPGLVAFNSLDPKKELRANQLKEPRTWTPIGAVGIHRSGNCIYAVNSPGGVKMVGRTPILIFDIERQNLVFKDKPVLFRPGDRIRLTPIDEREFLRIEKNIHTYQYEIEEGTYLIQ